MSVPAFDRIETPRLVYAMLRREWVERSPQKG